MRHKRENTGRNIAVAAAGIMTLLLILVWMFYYFVFERARTLRASLEKLEGPPVSFSVDSGFFEDLDEEENPYELYGTADYIKGETLAVELKFEALPGVEPTTLKIDGDEVALFVQVKGS